MNTTKKMKLLDFHFKKNLWANLFWVYKTAFIGSGMEFCEIRKYENGESIKNIDWKTTAKKWDLYIKKFEEERDLNVIFALDISKSMDFGTHDRTKKELQEELLYTLWFCAIENNDNIWAIIYDEEIKYFMYPQKWYANLYKIMEKFDTIWTKKKDTSKVFLEISKQHIKKSLIFVLTDDTNFDDEKILKIVWKENQIIIINIFDSFENNLWNEKAHISLNFFTDFININLNNTIKKEQYKKLRQQKINELKNKLQKNHIWYIYIDDTLNIYKELRQYFYKIS